MKEHGLDPGKWKEGEWKNWDKDTWLREAEDFVSPEGSMMCRARGICAMMSEKFAGR